jgi:hypothetical protein
MMLYEIRNKKRKKLTGHGYSMLALGLLPFISIIEMRTYKIALL